jgi:SnoaL-like protein
MSTEKNVQIVKNFFAALGRRDRQDLLALSAEDIEWIIPGEDWPLAGTHRGHAGLTNLLQKANETVETSYPEPPEFIAQGDRVLVVGVATGPALTFLNGLFGFSEKTRSRAAEIAGSVVATTVGGANASEPEKRAGARGGGNGRLSGYSSRQPYPSVKRAVA